MSAIPKQSLIGQPITKRDAPDKATGRAAYLQDLKLPRMLIGKVLRTDRTHARIISIDTAAAEAVPGVHAVVTAKDTPQVPLGFAKDNLPLKLDKVRGIHDEIAAVAADSEEAADAALSRIRVVYEDLPSLFSAEAAMQEGAPTIHEGRLRAARKARARLLEEAARQANVPADALDLRGGHVVQADNGVAVIAMDKLLRSLHFDREDGDVVITSDYYEPPSVMQDKNNHGDVSAAYTWACQIAEVDVDTETGIIRLLKVWSTHDVGKVINQLGIEGQIQGGVIMGAGYALTEYLIIDEGKVLNPSFADYKVFTATEVPDIDIGLIETNDPEGPFGAKGIGEAPVVPMAPAIVNAVYNAIGIRFTKLPLSPERVLRAIKGEPA